MNYGLGRTRQRRTHRNRSVLPGTGTQFVHIPYRGTAPAVADPAGRTNTAGDHRGAGASAACERRQTSCAGNGQPTRLPSAKEIATIAEAGVPCFEATQWYGVVAPAGTPAEIVARLNQEIREALKEPKILEALERDGAEPWPMSPDEFRAFISKEIPRWKKVVDGAKITVE